MAGLTMRTLVKELTENTDLSEKQVRAALGGLVESIQSTLMEEGGFVTIPGLGTFRSQKKGDRMARNPRTGEQSYVEPYLMPSFKPSTMMKDKVNGRR